MSANRSKGPLGRHARAVGFVCLLFLATVLGCDRPSPAPGGAPSAAAERPSILLITLDTTRADAIGPDASGVRTPAFDALASRGRRFRQAYATTPETLPSHVSMMTGLYPGGHGVHENARFLSARYPVVAERLQKAGYRTTAFLSSFALARRFGLARGFDLYDDEPAGGASERVARETADAALTELARDTAQSRFMWVHFYDPHYPYAAPEPFRREYESSPYLGEVAYMDEQMGRVLRAFEERARKPTAVVIASDHGEGLGEHGEALHGNLLYQSTMHVPLVIAGPGVSPGISDTPVSTRRICGTILDWAGLDSRDSLRGAVQEVVLGEAMKPFLEYGWQPQVMAIEGTQKAILAGKLEMYDLRSDPGEARDLGSGANLPSSLRARLEEYPVPGPETARAPEALDDEARSRLASLGYVGAGAAPVVRKDAPRPVDMTGIFADLDRASGLFAGGHYAAAVPLLAKILKADPYNLDATLRLATAHSFLGNDRAAVEAFRKAASLAPRSSDVRMYLGLHYARGPEWPTAVPLLEEVVREFPERVPALEALATIRERQGRVPEAIDLRRKLNTLRTPSFGELVQLGRLAMSAQRTEVALEAFEGARSRDARKFTHDLELGVLYLAAQRLPEAAAALDRVPASSSEYPMALFKRAQVSVLLREPDQSARIEAARRRANSTTQPLIERERLFGLAK